MVKAAKMKLMVDSPEQVVMVSFGPQLGEVTVGRGEHGNWWIHYY